MLAAVLVSLRPQQWVKNLFVFGGLVFGQRLFTPSVWPACGAFVIFCALSGAIYLVNDVADRDNDRLHPKKRERPIAAGRLPVGVALGVAVALVAGGLVAAAWLSTGVLLVAVAYVVLLTAYSAWLKHVVIVDVLAVAVGFVLRALAGTLAIDVAISGWLLICTVLIALFLALRGAARPDDRRRHRVDGDRVRALHDVAGDRREVPHAAAAGHAAVRAVWHLSLSLSALPPAARRQPVRALPPRPGAARQHGVLDRRGAADHLRHARGVVE
ncbi:MAG: hypothetical protein DMD85_05045 [Candidatus Rokuibacteriota bacterium]|nr:MAG: hypothetical protein DMD85_05045 [Candidatus Rokubacteria bacterium]